MTDDIREKLSAPFGVHELKFFPTALTKTDPKKGKVAAYIDSRAVMDRLDCVVGPSGWRTEYRVIDDGMKAVMCTLGVRMGPVGYDGAEWVYKSDVGYPNEGKDADNADKEPLKAAFSDALKRAAVQFGIGRYIYSLELEQDWLPVDAYGKFTQQPRIKGSPQQGATDRGAPSGGPDKSAPKAHSPEPAPATAPAAAPANKPKFWDVTRQMGYGDDQVIAFAKSQFQKEPKDLTPDERRRLVVSLEDVKKKEAAGVA